MRDAPGLEADLRAEQSVFFLLMVVVVAPEKFEAKALLRVSDPPDAGDRVHPDKPGRLQGQEGVGRHRVGLVGAVVRVKLENLKEKKMVTISRMQHCLVFFFLYAFLSPVWRLPRSSPSTSSRPC